MNLYLNTFDRDFIIILEFINNGKYARCLIDLVQGSGGVDFDANRYFVVEKTLQDFVKNKLEKAEINVVIK